LANTFPLGTGFPPAAIARRAPDTGGVKFILAPATEATQVQQQPAKGASA